MLPVELTTGPVIFVVYLTTKAVVGITINIPIPGITAENANFE